MYRYDFRFIIGLIVTVLIFFSIGFAASDSEAPAHEPIPFKAGESTDALWGYRDASGAVRIRPQFAYAEPFSEGLAAVWLECGRESEESPINHCWAYIDAQGRFVSSHRFEAAGAFDEGRAPVVFQGDIVFINRRGEVSGRLGTAEAPLPEPAEPVGSLEAYGEQLGAASRKYTLKENPISGEALRILEVRALRFGVLETRVAGWEGDGYILSIPGLSLDAGVALAKRLFSRTDYRDVTSMEIFPGEIVFEDPSPEYAGDFIRIRHRPGGGVEIEHTRWFS